VKRNIKLISIKDVNVIDFVDGGVDREGEPTSQRQALTRILGKRVSAVVDGKEHVLPCFLISEVGDWRLATAERLPNGDEFLAYEQDVIRREHPERMLSVWKKAQAQFISQSSERRRYAEHQAEQAQAGDVAKVISQMVRTISTQTAAPAVRKGGPNV
jgi:hypothetical protein